MATVRESKRLVCTECEKEVCGCYDCGKDFIIGQNITCEVDGLRHLCDECI